MTMLSQTKDMIPTIFKSGPRLHSTLWYCDQALSRHDWEQYWTSQQWWHLWGIGNILIQVLEGWRIRTTIKSVSSKIQPQQPPPPKTWSKNGQLMKNCNSNHDWFRCWFVDKMKSSTWLVMACYNFFFNPICQSTEKSDSIMEVLLYYSNVIPTYGKGATKVWKQQSQWERVFSGSRTAA